MMPVMNNVQRVLSLHRLSYWDAGIFLVKEFRHTDFCGCQYKIYRVYICIMEHYDTLGCDMFYIHIFTLFCVYIAIAFHILIILCYIFNVRHSRCISTDVSMKQTVCI